mmetsp:Transcript_2188/g.4915  ORF Transcript_2188/g.4915 Transcript_2188/m.4915 type:complete len:219 (+) Transcript_2188:55-711(+)
MTRFSNLYNPCSVCHIYWLEALAQGETHQYSGNALTKRRRGRRSLQRMLPSDSMLPLSSPRTCSPSSCFVQHLQSCRVQGKVSHGKGLMPAGQLQVLHCLSWVEKQPRPATPRLQLPTPMHWMLLSRLQQPMLLRNQHLALGTSQLTVTSRTVHCFPTTAALRPSLLRQQRPLLLLPLHPMKPARRQLQQLLRQSWLRQLLRGQAPWVWCRILLTCTA